MLSYPNGSYPKQWVLKTPAGRDSCEATVVCPQSVVATGSSLIYGNGGFRSDFLTGFKGRSRVISLAAGESDGRPGRAADWRSHVLAPPSSDPLCPLLLRGQPLCLPRARPSRICPIQDLISSCPSPTT